MKKRILCVLLICFFTLSLSLVFVWVGVEKKHIPLNFIIMMADTKLGHH